MFASTPIGALVTLLGVPGNATGKVNVVKVVGAETRVQTAAAHGVVRAFAFEGASSPQVHQRRAGRLQVELRVPRKVIDRGRGGHREHVDSVFSENDF
jgi:hypothetical protein